MTVTENTETTFKVKTEEGPIVRIMSGSYGTATLDVGIPGALSYSNIEFEDAHALADWIKENVPEPKPAWHDANIGEVWVLEPLSVPYTVVGSPGGEVWFTRADVFGQVERREIKESYFTGGLRIWPAPEGETNA